MTFEEYIQNPMGKENAVISNREMYRRLYTEKLDKILMREAGKIDIYPYVDGKKYICHLKIPSESSANIYYDVVIEFTLPKDNPNETNLKKYNVRFYSNDPSFVYTFAYSFLRNGLFFTDFKDRMSKTALKTPALAKNQYNQVGYVKSLYFAYIIMDRRGYFGTGLYTKKYSASRVKSEVIHADKKIQEIHDSKASTKKKREVKKIGNNDVLAPDIPIKPKTAIGKTNKIPRTKRSTRRIGKIRKK